MAPHRYRVLVPLTLQPIIAVAGRFMTSEQAFQRVYDVFYLIAFAVMLLALGTYLRSWFTEDQALVGILLVAATLPIALRNNFFEPASFVEPTLMTIALLWTYRGQAWRVVPITVVASFTRETAVFIPVACWFAAAGSAVAYPRGTMTKIAVAALACSVAIFGGLRWWLGIAPQISIADVWAINTGREGLLAALVNGSLFLGATGWILAAAGYRGAPVFVRRALRFAPIYLAAVAVFGVWYEVRLLMPLYPVLVPCVLSAIVQPRINAAGHPIVR
jgi:hypothetical protein